MTTIPTTEPAQVTAGDTIQWTKSISDYPANAGWTLSYVLLSAKNKITFSGSASGADHAVTIAAATSASWAADTYQWQSYVTNGSERHNIGSGSMIVLPNFASKSASDQRSWVKRTLDNIEAVIENRATMDQMEYTIEGRSLKRMEIADLLAFRDRFAALYKQELAAQNLGNGLSGKNRIYVRF